MIELFICQWCGYVEERIVDQEGDELLLHCACCSKEVVESLFSE